MGNNPVIFLVLQQVFKTTQEILIINNIITPHLMMIKMTKIKMNMLMMKMIKIKMIKIKMIKIKIKMIKLNIQMTAMIIVLFSALQQQKESDLPSKGAQFTKPVDVRMTPSYYHHHHQYYYHIIIIIL